MPWHFVGRTELLERASTALATPAFSPIMITGEPGMGRSAVLTEILRRTDSEHDEVLRIEPVGGRRGATVQGLLANGSAGRAPLRDLVPALTEVLTERATGRRIVVAVDDAHLADHDSMLALRDLARRRTLRLVVTRVATPALTRPPDATECLRYERGLVTLCLAPLDVEEVGDLLTEVTGARPHPATGQAFHTATGGSPALLRDLLAEPLLGRTLDQDGRWRLGEPSDADPSLRSADPERLVTAAAQAWRDLALDQVEELCRLARWCGVGDRVAQLRAVTLLLRGHALQALHVLDSVPDEPARVLVRALVLALGCGRPAAAGKLLLNAARQDSAPHDAALIERALACRAWLLAVAGLPVTLPDRPDRTDRQAAVYEQAALATIALRSGMAAEAVCHLRRAIATADQCRTDLPWMGPFLTGCLIDALLLAGRINEATEAASEFHAGKPGCGWDVAVAVSELTSGSTLPNALVEGDQQREQA